MNGAEKALIGAVIVLIASIALVSVVSDDSDADTLYSVTLKGNGGSDSGGSTQKSYSVISGQGFTLPSNTFTRDGYILFGWSAASTGAVQWYPGQETTITSNKTLYAVWEDLTYRGIFKIGGSSDDTTSEAGVVQTTVGGAVNLDPSGIIYNLMKEAAYQRTDIKYGLSVSYCGDVKSSEAIGKNISISADWLTLNVSSYGEFTFSGSLTRPGVHTVEVTMKTKGFSGSYGDLEDLLLRWYVVIPVSADEHPTLAFDMDGGTGTVDSVTGPVGTAIVLPNYTDSSGNPISKTGYTLVGWEIPDGKGGKSVYALGSLYTISFSATVKAKWISDPNVLVYSLDGGSLANVEAYVVHNGSSITLRDSGVSKEGHTFLGWRPRHDPGIAYAPGLTIESNGSMYMQAYFVENGTSLHTVTYNANGGQMVNGVYSQQVEPGMYVQLPSRLSIVREGYTFVAWSESQTSTTGFIDGYKIERNTTLYAIWDQNSVPVDPDPQPAQYTVSFSPNQGQGNFPSQSVMSGGYVVRPPDPTRDGHVFLGWKPLTKPGYWNFLSDTVTGDTILEAQWAEHFTVTVDGPIVTIQLKGIYRDMAFDVDWGDIYGAISETVEPSVGTAKHTYTIRDKDGNIVYVASYGYITVTSHDSSPKPYISRMPYSVEGEHYNPPSIYIVRFEPGNGDPSFTQDVIPGNRATDPKTPVWEGHTFTGWYHGGSKWDFSKPVTSHMTLMGGWDNNIPNPPPTIVPKAEFTITKTANGWRMDASSSNNAMAYNWILDAKTIGTGKTIDVDSEGLDVGTHTITLVVVSSSGHTDSLSKVIIVQPPGGEDTGPTPGGVKSWFKQNWWIVAVILVLVAFMAVRFWI